MQRPEWCRTLHTPETKCKQETGACAKSPQDIMGDCRCCSRGTRTEEPRRTASPPYLKLTCLVRLRSEARLHGPLTKLHTLAWWWTCCCLDFNHWMGLHVLQSIISSKQHDIACLNAKQHYYIVSLSAQPSLKEGTVFVIYKLKHKLSLASLTLLHCISECTTQSEGGDTLCYLQTQAQAFPCLSHIITLYLWVHNPVWRRGHSLLSTNSSTSFPLPLSHYYIVSLSAQPSLKEGTLFVIYKLKHKLSLASLTLLHCISECTTQSEGGDSLCYLQTQAQAFPCLSHIITLYLWVHNPVWRRGHSLLSTNSSTSFPLPLSHYYIVSLSAQPSLKEGTLFVIYKLKHKLSLASLTLLHCISECTTQSEGGDTLCYLQTQAQAFPCLSHIITSW